MNLDEKRPARKASVIVRENGAITRYPGRLPADVRARIDAGLADGSVRVSFVPASSR